MHVVIVSCVFPPEPVVSARTSASLLSGLIARGDRVTVITSFPSRPTGKLFPGYYRRLYFKESAQANYTLLRCFSIFSSSSSLLSRLLENISFGVTSSLALLFTRQTDVVYLNTWPIFATSFAVMVCKLRRIPFVLSVQDLYPESLAIQGRLKTASWLFKLLAQLDRWIARQATKVMVISERFREIYLNLRHVPVENIHVVPNWIDPNSITLSGQNNFRQEIGISEEAFVLLYGGNIGRAAGVEKVIEASRSIQSKREIVLIIAGSGSSLSECRRLADQIQSIKIIFHSPWLPEETSKVLSAANVLLLSTQGQQSLASVPSKLLFYMLAAKPILGIVLPESDTAQIITAANCGWIFAPDKLDSLWRKVEELAALPDSILASIGKAGRIYVQQNFIAEKWMPKIIQILDQVKNCKNDRDSKSRA